MDYAARFGLIVDEMKPGEVTTKPVPMTSAAFETLHVLYNWKEEFCPAASEVGSPASVNMLLRYGFAQKEKSIHRSLRITKLGKMKYESLKGKENDEHNPEVGR